MASAPARTPPSPFPPRTPPLRPPGGDEAYDLSHRQILISPSIAGPDHGDILTGNTGRQMPRCHLPRIFRRRSYRFRIIPAMVRAHPRSGMAQWAGGGVRHCPAPSGEAPGQRGRPGSRDFWHQCPCALLFRIGERIVGRLMKVNMVDSYRANERQLRDDASPSSTCRFARAEVDVKTGTGWPAQMFFHPRLLHVACSSQLTPQRGRQLYEC